MPIIFVWVSDTIVGIFSPVGHWVSQAFGQTSSHSARQSFYQSLSPSVTQSVGQSVSYSVASSQVKSNAFITSFIAIRVPTCDDHYSAKPVTQWVPLDLNCTLNGDFWTQTPIWLLVFLIDCLHSLPCFRLLLKDTWESDLPSTAFWVWLRNATVWALWQVLGIIGACQGFVVNLPHKPGIIYVDAMTWRERLATGALSKRRETGSIPFCTSTT